MSKVSLEKLAKIKLWAINNPDKRRQIVRDCQRRRRLKIRLVRLERRKFYKHNWYITNKSSCAERHKLWAQTHVEENKIIKNRYCKTQRGKLVRRVNNRRRNILLRNLTVEVVQQIYQENIIRFGVLTCELCFKPVVFGEDSLEHFVPLKRGGSNERVNLGVAHSLCNSIKGSKTLEEYKLWVGTKGTLLNCLT